MDDFDTAVVRHMKRMVTTRQNGIIKPMTMRDAMIAKQAEVALKGSPYAIRHVLMMDKQATERQAQERKVERESWVLIKKSQKLRHATAIANGDDLDQILPHPDDIIIDADEVHIVGPRDAAALAACRKAMLLRDLLFLQQGLEDRLQEGTDHISEDVAKPTSPLLFACYVNLVLPKRFQLSKTAELEALQRATSKYTKRELLTLCHQGWAQFGVHLPRGAKLAGIGISISYLDITLDTLARIKEAEGNRLDVEEALNVAQDRILEELPLKDAAPVPQAYFAKRGMR